MPQTPHPYAGTTIGQDGRRVPIEADVESPPTEHEDGDPWADGPPGVDDARHEPTGGPEDVRQEGIDEVLDGDDVPEGSSGPPVTDEDKAAAAAVVEEAP